MTRAVGIRQQLVHFYVHPKIFEAIKRVAELRSTTYSEVLRQACRDYLVREAAKATAESKTITEIKA